MIVIGGEDDLQPVKVKIFKNKPGMTFDDVAKDSDQELKLSPDPNGEIQYPLKTTKFNNVHHLTLFFPESVGSEQTKVSISIDF